MAVICFVSVSALCQGFVWAQNAKELFVCNALPQQNRVTCGEKLLTAGICPIAAAPQAAQDASSTFGPKGPKRLRWVTSWANGSSFHSNKTDTSMQLDPPDVKVHSSFLILPPRHRP